MAPSAPTVEPAAPIVRGPLPWVRGGLGLLSDPTAYFARQRRSHGDTFVVEAFGHRLFCVFSPEGVRSLYAQPEDKASFGIATYQLIKAKVPVELLLGRRNHPKTLFGSQRVESYLDHLKEAVDLELVRLGPAGTFEIFAEMRRLGHRLGLASWAGSEAASEPYVERLIPLFDRLDSSESFVRPGQAALTWATRKRREWAAMGGIERIFTEIIEGRAGRPPVDDFLTQILESYSDLSDDERAVAAARDVIVIHMGSQSNLYAALAWTLVNLVQRPDLLERVSAGDDELLDRCANESCARCSRPSRWTRAPAPTASARGSCCAPCSPPTTPRPPRDSTASTPTTTRADACPRGFPSRPRSWSAPSATGCTPARRPASPSRPSVWPPGASSTGTS